MPTKTPTIKDGWQKLKLGDLGSIDRGRSRHRPRNDESLYGGEYPFIQTGDIKSANFYITSYHQSYNKKGLAQSKLWEPNTLAITIAANIMETAILKIPACFPDSIAGFRSYEKKSDIKFVKYLLDFFKKDFQLISHGAAQDNLSLEKIKTINFNVPEYTEQKKIAEVLGVYDDLIEVNQKKIKILEDMVQTIYKEWFVKPVKNGLPDGWEVKKVENLLETVKRKNKIKTDQYLIEGKYPIVDQGKDFLGGYTNDEETIYNEDLIVFGDHTRCFKYCNFDFACGADGTQLLKTKDSEKVPQILLYFFVINAELKNDHYARHFKFLKALDVVVPDKELVNKFSGIADIFYKQIRELNLQNKNLQKTRDLLIPQLVGGRIDFK